MIIFFGVLGGVATIMFSGVDTQKPSLPFSLFILGFSLFALVSFVVVPIKVYQAIQVEEALKAPLLELPASEAEFLSLQLAEIAEIHTYVPLKPDMSPVLHVLLIGLVVTPMATVTGYFQYRSYTSGQLDGMLQSFWTVLFGGFYTYLLYLILQILLVGKTTILVSNDKLRPGGYFKALIYQAGCYRIERLELGLEMRENYLQSDSVNYKVLHTSSILQQENIYAMGTAPLLYFSAQIPPKAPPGSKTKMSEFVWYIRIKLIISGRPNKTQHFRIQVIENPGA